MQNRNWLHNRAVLLELFVIINLSFLALDVFIAHSVNSFAHRAEWIPLIFSLVAPLLLLLTLFRGKGRIKRCVGYGVGWFSVFIGVGGMLFHLESQFFADLTVRSLVYTAPFIAPLSYAGIGLLIIMHHTVQANTSEWGKWLLFMTFAGFLGNYVLSLCDHAQNGFFNWIEWIPVCTSAMAVGFLMTAIVQSDNVPFLRFCLAILVLNSVTGVVGFCLHVSANLQVATSSVKDSFLYGAPAFAPLLFPNLSLLGALGIFGVIRGSPRM